MSLAILTVIGFSSAKEKSAAFKKMNLSATLFNDYTPYVIKTENDYSDGVPYHKPSKIKKRKKHGIIIAAFILFFV